MISRRLWILTAFALAACGGDDGVPPGDDVLDEPVTMPSEVGLQVPAQLDTGELLTVTWTTDVPAGTRLGLLLRESGDPITPSSAGYLSTGSARPSGPQWWIDPDGAAVAAGTTLAELVEVGPATDGGVDVILPSDAEGDWSVAAVLIDADEALIAFATATVWIASGPGIRLDLSRTSAEPDDVVRAAVELRGAELEPLRLSGWLTTPDGEILSLPGLGTEYQPIGEGELTSGRIELLSEHLGRYGDGDYLVTLSLETLDGIRRGEAGAVIQVCSASSTITGQIATVDGAPLGGGVITALDPIDGAVITGVVGPDGAFTIEAPAGPYMLVAYGGGGWEAAGDVSVACGATASTTVVGRDVLGDSKPLARRAPPPPPHLSGGNSAMPPIKVVVFPAGHPEGVACTVDKDCFLSKCGEDQLCRHAAIVANQSKLRDTLVYVLRDELTAHAELAGGPIVFNSRETISDMGQAEVASELQGEQTGAAQLAVAAVEAALTPQFVIGLTISELGEKYVFAAKLVNEATNQTLLAVQAVVDDLTDDASVKLAGLAAALLTASDGPLVPYLWTLVDRPRNPDLRITLDKLKAPPGATVTATLTVRDASPSSLVCGVPATLKVESPDYVVLATTTALTNDQGVITLTFTIPMTGAAPSYYVNGRFERDSFRSGDIAPVQHVDVLPIGFAGLVTAPKGTLLTDERVEVRVSTTGFAPFVFFTGQNGTPDTTSAPASDGLIDFIAGPVQGPALLVSTFFPLSPGPQIVLPLRFFVISPIHFTALADPNPSTVNDGYVGIRGIVQKQGVPQRNVAVAFTLAGNGSITPGVKTNDDGAYFALFHAPPTGTGTTTVSATVVVDAHEVVKTVELAYATPCTDCPVQIYPSTSNLDMLPKPKGGTQLFTANQPVTWSVTGDATMSSQGQFTAGQTGGTVIIRATSTQDSSRFAIQRVVVDCTLAEVLGTGTFTGALTATTALAPYDCSTSGRVEVANIGGAYSVNALLVCSPDRSMWSGYPNLVEGACTLGPTILGATPPCPEGGRFGPNPDEPGMATRLVTAFTQREESDGSCTTVFQGSGILSQ